jgi:catechol 2,3-dioxygenase-like lactoylglutathione lyase family enzyme
MNAPLFPRMHVSLWVSDLTKSVDFYSRFFGVAPAKLKSQYAKFVLDKPSLIISFIEDPGKVQQNFGHLGFQVETPQELELKMKSAIESGILTRVETETGCCYALQDKFWATDPDGISWEVYYFKGDIDVYKSQSANVCCTPTAPVMHETSGIKSSRSQNPACC